MQVNDVVFEHVFVVIIQPKPRQNLVKISELLSLTLVMQHLRLHRRVSGQSVHQL